MATVNRDSRPLGFIPRGKWNESESYTALHLVEHNGSSWTVRTNYSAPVQGIEPGADNAVWQLVAQGHEERYDFIEGAYSGFTEIYMDAVNGDDENDALSIATPRKTWDGLRDRLRTLDFGRTLYVRVNLAAGTYTAPTGDNGRLAFSGGDLPRGTTNYIQFVGAGGESTVLNSVNSNNYSLYIQRIGRIDFDGIYFPNGVRIDDYTLCVFNNCTFGNGNTGSINGVITAVNHCYVIISNRCVFKGLVPLEDVYPKYCLQMIVYSYVVINTDTSIEFTDGFGITQYFAFASSGSGIGVNVITCTGTLNLPTNGTAYTSIIGGDYGAALFYHPSAELPTVNTGIIYRQPLIHSGNYSTLLAARNVLKYAFRFNGATGVVSAGNGDQFGLVSFTKNGTGSFTARVMSPITNTALPIIHPYGNNINTVHPVVKTNFSVTGAGVVQQADVLLRFYDADNNLVDPQLVNVIGY